MKQYRLRSAPLIVQVLSPAAVFLLILLGWYIVVAQSQNISKTTIAAYQQTQLEIVRSVARSIEVYVAIQVEELGRTDVSAIEQEIFTKFVAPVQLLENGDAWIYAPDHVVFDLSSDFPAEYRGKSMAEIFLLQVKNGASHYEEMTHAVMQAQEGVGWYIWLPDKGREIAAWTPVNVRGLVWTIGLSTPLPEIMASAGATAQINTAITLMSLGTLLALALLAAWMISTKRRNQAEAALQISEEALRQAQKTESLGVLAGGVAHDFNNLLAAISGQAELASLKLSTNHAASEHLDQIHKAAMRAADLTSNLLAYTGRSRFEVTMIDLNELIGDNLPLFQAAIPKNVELTANLMSALPNVDGDRGQLQQLLMNLIINAAEAIGDHSGRVVVATTVQAVTAAETHLRMYTGQTLEPGSYVVLEVRDNGCGMSPETLSKIFDPFFTTKFTGRGLGLASVLGIVRGHKGGLEVKSTPNHGTIFRIFFPTSQASKPDVIAAPSHAEPQKLDGLVLVIDDEEPVRRAVADILNFNGLRVFTAADGLEGVAFYRLHHNEVRLVLLDLSMPGVSGEETLRLLREVRPDVRVLLSSGYSQTDLFGRASQLGITGFLQKPYDIQQLLDRVTEQLA